MPNLHISGQEFENIIVMLQISALEFVLFQSLVKKIKIPKFGTKNALFGIFALEFEKTAVIFEISSPKFA